MLSYTTSIAATAVVLALLHHYFILPILIRYALSSLGVYLRFKTRARRELIVEKARAEAREANKKRSRPPSRDDEDWEKVEGYAAGSAKNGGRAEADWHGMIGFFHPFW
jgi:alpha-1,2-mannosyltransferase